MVEGSQLASELSQLNAKQVSCPSQTTTPSDQKKAQTGPFTLTAEIIETGDLTF